MFRCVFFCHSHSVFYLLYLQLFYIKGWTGKRCEIQLLSIENYSSHCFPSPPPGVYWPPLQSPCSWLSFSDQKLMSQLKLPLELDVHLILDCEPLRCWYVLITVVGSSFEQRSKWAMGMASLKLFQLTLTGPISANLLVTYTQILFT